MFETFGLYHEHLPFEIDSSGKMCEQCSEFWTHSATHLEYIFFLSPHFSPTFSSFSVFLINTSNYYDTSLQTELALL